MAVGIGGGWQVGMQMPSWRMGRRDHDRHGYRDAFGLGIPIDFKSLIPQVAVFRDRPRILA